ncbi:hypothetical protein K431DRAFT_95060 [Polychaeton citri CBS 116435]|uniref:Uncharacterized protein n=1 Tax=Polychaeton citri CBS 116435 TaxID=1314669 RepID=A0A9P4Q928_9PEZI|nr:hypothetical protein K431DRAFT_95060 [Polychaeton citri CBS 116435]
MPKNPFKATRRKSSGNVLDYQAESPEPAQSSFRVLERPKDTPDGNRGTTPGRASGRPFTSHLVPLRGKSADDLGLKGDRWVTDRESSANVKKEQQLIAGRGSGGSGSSAHYDSSTGSARYSSTSTLPSSVDQEPSAEEDLYPVSRPQKSATSPMPQHAPIDDDLPPVPSFASRTGRALSFGFKNRLNSSQSNKSFGLLPPGGQSRVENRQSPPHRDRAETASSYASTAVPPRLDANPSLNTSGLDFGEDFGDMFASRRSTPDINLPPVPPPHAFHRTVSLLSEIRIRARTDRKRRNLSPCTHHGHIRDRLLHAPLP